MARHGRVKSRNEHQDGDKIAQLVMMPVVHFQPQENIEGTLYDYPKTISNRGTGALGSTDV